MIKGENSFKRKETFKSDEGLIGKSNIPPVDALLRDYHQKRARNTSKQTVKQIQFLFSLSV